MKKWIVRAKTRIRNVMKVDRQDKYDDPECYGSGSAGQRRGSRVFCGSGSVRHRQGPGVSRMWIYKANVVFIISIIPKLVVTHIMKFIDFFSDIHFVFIISCLSYWARVTSLESLV